MILNAVAIRSIPLVAANDRSGNPYASLAQLGDDDERIVLPGAKSAPASPPPSEAISKVDFENACRQILRRYIPALERGRLGPEYRAFIERNRVRSARARSRILLGLRKYDLGEVSGLQPQFNREKESLTAEKLREIEVMA